MTRQGGKGIRVRGLGRKSFRFGGFAPTEAEQTRCGTVGTALGLKPGSNFPFDKLPGAGVIVKGIENGNSGLVGTGMMRRYFEVRMQSC